MKVFRCAALFCLAFVFGIVPKASARTVDTQILAQIHKIAIIVSLGDRADIMLRGITVFDTKGGSLPLAGSDLDDAAIREAVSLLSSRFEIVPVTYDKASFVLKDELRGVGPSLTNLIRAMPPDGVDAFLVIRKQAFFLPYPDRYVMDGLGALRYRRVLSKSDAPNVRGIVFADLEVALVQAGTGNVLIDKSDRESTLEDEGDWADTPKTMTDVQAAKLRHRLSDLVPQTVAACLAKMHLSTP